MNITIIIPTYCEAENIEPITQEIFKYLPDANILIVDDNSPDDTEKIAAALCRKNPKIKFISRKGKPRSFARSYTEGFKIALADNADYIIQMDADFSHNPKYLPQMIESLKNYDLMIGSRYIPGGGTKNWSFMRKFISWGGNFYSKIITGVPVNDLTSGFAIWKTEALKKIDLDNINSNGYAFQIEMKFNAYRNGSKIKEFPIIFIDRELGNSKMGKKIILEAALSCLKFTVPKNPQANSLQDEKIKDYYRYIENYDWTLASDKFVGPETFLHRNRSKKIIQIINQNFIKNGKYLDIGCGTGLITRHLPPGSFGLDINPRNLEKARKYAPQINFIESDAEKTGLPSEAFDLIVCTEVLEHFLNPIKTLDEIKRILKPQGVLIGSVPSNGLLWKLRFLSRTCGTQEPYHKHFSKSEITSFLKNNFKEIALTGDATKMNWFFICHYPKK